MKFTDDFNSDQGKPWVPVELKIIFDDPDDIAAVEMLLEDYDHQIYNEDANELVANAKRNWKELFTFIKDQQPA